MNPSSGFQRIAAWTAVALGVVILALGIFLWLQGARGLGIVLVCFAVLDTSFWLYRALSARRDAA